MFASEQEFRLIHWIPEIDNSVQYLLGVRVDVDLEILIDKIIISPEITKETFQTISTLIEDYKLVVPVSRSILSESYPYTPVYDLS